MSEQTMPWDDEALQRLEKIPSFMQGMAKGKIGKEAIAAGEKRVTEAFMDASKAKMMG